MKTKIGQNMVATATKYVGVWMSLCFALALGLGLAFTDLSVAVWIGVAGLLAGLLIDRVVAVRATKHYQD